MKPRHSFVSLMLALLFLISTADLLAAERFRVIASIKPIHSILAGLTQGTDVLELLVPEGRTPYGYELTEQQKENLKSADMVVWVGPELERFLADQIQTVKQDASVITLLEHPALKVLPSRWDESRRDPFFWLDSRNVIILVDALTRELMIADAPRSHLYKRNRDTLLARMAKLDRRLEYGYRGLKGGFAIAYYDTLQYFEQAYALKITNVVAQSPFTPVNAKNLLQGRSELTANSYACLLTESNIKMPDLQLLTGGGEVNIGELDSFGSRLKSGPELYFELMDHNSSVIKRCLHYGTSTETPGRVEEFDPSIKIGGKFLLLDHNGKLVTEKDFLGKYQMLYFGYTFCPDVCPTTLQVMSVALDSLGPKADMIQPYFITLDPERDTVQVMNRYINFFKIDLIGLTGSRSMTDRVAKQFRVRFEKVVEEGMDPGLYILDHTASVFLMAPDGRFITKFAYGISAKQMVEKINQHIP